MFLNLLIHRLLLCGTAVVVACMLQACSCSSADCDTSTVSLPVQLQPADTLARYKVRMADMPDSGCVRMRIRPVGGSLARVFNDSNHVQLQSARALGIKPVTTLGDAWNAGRGLTKVMSCREYYVDSLTHSQPYLVDDAAALLKEIGRRFNDSLAARGGGSYRMKVTSVLRTQGAVARLRRSNVNATSESAHQFGTTFDISYAKFICDSVTVARTQEDLKNLLAEVLKQLRDEERCYVKYERRQGCFHITVRAPRS